MPASFASKPPISTVSCRPGCGACCIAPSISSAIPGMPNGKPAGVRCIQLDEDNACRIFGSPLRPKVCGGLQPELAMCGPDRTHAMQFLTDLEAATA
ncbi:MAG TPA: YkgJ family cysteine cluster protein [Burkholderiaceae bacterium]